MLIWMWSKLGKYIWKCRFYNLKMFRVYCVLFLKEIKINVKWFFEGFRYLKRDYYRD